MRHFDNIFLVDHYTKGFFHQLIHFRVDGFIGSAISNGVKSFYVSTHHSGACNSRTDDRACSNQGEIIFTPELTQEHSHGGRFYIKTAKGPALAKELPDPGIFLEVLEAPHVH